MGRQDLILSNVNTYVHGFIVDSDEDVAMEQDFEISLCEMRRLTHCGTVEVIVRYIGDRRFVIVHGVRSGEGKATALDEANNIVLVNPVIVAGIRQYPEGYEIRSLKEDEVAHIKDNLGLMYIHDDGGRGGSNAYCLKNVGKRPVTKGDEQ